jgi:hypothetical protein
MEIGKTGICSRSVIYIRGDVYAAPYYSKSKVENSVCFISDWSNRGIGAEYRRQNSSCQDTRKHASIADEPRPKEIAGHYSHKSEGASNHDCKIRWIPRSIAVKECLIVVEEISSVEDVVPIQLQQPFTERIADRGIH